MRRNVNSSMSTETKLELVFSVQPAVQSERDVSRIQDEVMRTSPWRKLVCSRR